MATSKTSSILPLEENEGLSHELIELLSYLPREDGWRARSLYLYQGLWYREFQLSGVVTCQKHFQADDSDLILATAPKAGTTWLKALTFSIMQRNHYPHTQQPLLTTNPHKLIPNLEIDLYSKNQVPDLDDLRPPGLFSTHLSYSSLPKSIHDSNCKVIYICRNPKDMFISQWHFLNKLAPMDQTPVPLKEAFELFCMGISWCGPFWDHALGYWKASLERPTKVMFLKYEELKSEPLVHLKRLAKYLGCPFTAKEEREGVIEEIVRFCSFENLSSLDVNKNGKMPNGLENKVFFRRGEVGDSSNYLTTQMIERLDRLTEQMLQGSGLMFEVSPVAEV